MLLRQLQIRKLSYDVKILGPDLLDKSIELMQNVFVKHEIVSKAINLYKHPEAVDEFVQLPREIAKDGISLVAVKHDKPISVAFNRIFGENDAFFADFLINLKSPLTRFYVNLMNDAEKRCNFAEAANAKNFFELIFGCTDPEFADKKIQHNLVHHCLDLAERLSKCNDDKMIYLGSEIAVKKRPEVFLGIATHKKFKQMAVHSLKMQVAGECYYKDILFNGKPLSEVMEDKNASELFIFKKLLAKKQEIF